MTELHSKKVLVITWFFFVRILAWVLVVICLLRGDAIFGFIISLLWTIARGNPIMIMRLQKTIPLATTPKVFIYMLASPIDNRFFKKQLRGTQHMKAFGVNFCPQWCRFFSTNPPPTLWANATLHATCTTSYGSMSRVYSFADKCRYNDTRYESYFRSFRR